jgi:hypothetical protein
MINDNVRKTKKPRDNRPGLQKANLAGDKPM